MPKPNSKKVSPKHVFDATLDQLPGKKKKTLEQLRAEEASFYDEVEELENIAVDDFMNNYPKD